MLPQPDGYQRCFLDDVSEADALRFAEAMEEVLAPVWEPRWLIGRRVLDEPPSLAGAARVLATGLPGRLARGRVAYHAVPDSPRPAGSGWRAFERAWPPSARASGPSEPRMPKARILAAHRGEDPFRIETQRRTLWT
ncbi:MAG: hypothetical protein U0667_11365 [Chloroflexota bacterium]